MGEAKVSNHKYEDLFLAYVDILGFKKMVADSEKKDTNMFDKIEKALATINREKSSDKGEIVFKVTTFSDNIVISCSADGGLTAFCTLIKKLIKLQATLLRDGVLVRGGIAKGLAHHVEDMVFGPAMVDAYELESKYAVYPRIIVEKDVVDWATSDPREEEVHYLGELEGLLKSDVYNDISYIDILNRNVNEISTNSYLSLMRKVKAIIEEGLKNKNKEVLKKYVWLKNYYNNIINHSSFRVKDDLRISERQKTESDETASTNLKGQGEDVDKESDEESKKAPSTEDVTKLGSHSQGKANNSQDKEPMKTPDDINTKQKNEQHNDYNELVSHIDQIFKKAKH